MVLFDVYFTIYYLYQPFKSDARGISPPEHPACAPAHAHTTYNTDTSVESWLTFLRI
jgi:hypothetical protein